MCIRDRVTAAFRSTYQHFVYYWDYGAKTGRFFVNGSEVTFSKLGSSTNSQIEVIASLTVGQNDIQGPLFMKDMRVYNGNQLGDSLSTLVTNLYNAGIEGTGNTTGMIFKPLNVPNDKVASYVGATLTEDMKITDSVGYSVGTPKNSPIGQSA
jgi:hypothetical protein